MTPTKLVFFLVAWMVLGLGITGGLMSLGLHGFSVYVIGGIGGFSLSTLSLGKVKM